MEVKVSLPGRDEISLKVEMDGDGQIKSAHLHGIGGPELLALLQEWRPKLTGVLQKVELPLGESPAAVLMREVLLKAQGRWQPPYEEAELCHCRGIPTDIVDMAIVTGAHTPEKVSRLTSASTACGTCRPNVEAMLNYRLRTTS